MRASPDLNASVRTHLVQPVLDEVRGRSKALHEAAAVCADEALLGLLHEHFRAIEAALRMIDDYEALRDAALGTMPIDDRLTAFLEGTRVMLDTKLAAILLLDENGKELWPHTTSGFETAVGISPLPINGRLRKVVSHDEPLIVDDLDGSEEFQKRLLDEGVQSVMVVPLRAGASLAGALLCGHPGKAKFNARDLELLGLVAQRMGAGLERNRILEVHRRGRREAERRSEFRSTLLQMATHDLKTPLTAILLQLRLLERPDIKAEQFAKSMGMVKRNVQRLDSMLDGFLDLARLEAGRLTIHPAPCSVQELLQDCDDLFSAQASEKGLVLRLEAGSVGELNVDRMRIGQVLANLVSNAIRYSERGTITMTAQRGPDEVVVKVHDEGNGIAPQEACRLFVPFSQLDAGPGRPGTGLGLYLSQAIVKAHGGSLTLQSAGLGLGSTATVRLPFAA